MLCIGGRKSRNKVIVGEPAIGSLMIAPLLLGRFLLMDRLDISILFIPQTIMGDASAYFAKKGETFLDNLSEV